MLKQKKKKKTVYGLSIYFVKCVAHWKKKKNIPNRHKRLRFQLLIMHVLPDISNTNQFSFILLLLLFLLT